MKEFKGSKGNWDLLDFSDEIIIENAEKDHVVSIRCVNNRLIKLANAKLIANAPEMLELLQRLLNLKQIKEKHGKTPYYLEEQPKTWKEVEYLLNKILE